VSGLRQPTPAEVETRDGTVQAITPAAPPAAMAALQQVRVVRIWLPDHRN
jgi:hypothetical protein